MGDTQDPKTQPGSRGVIWPREYTDPTEETSRKLNMYSSTHRVVFFLALFGSFCLPSLGNSLSSAVTFAVVISGLSAHLRLG